MESLREVAIYDIQAGDRIRLVVNYAHAWRPIFWLMVGKDGSVYLGPRYANITRLRKGVAAVKEGAARITYGEGREVTDSAGLKAAKLSIHASGVVNAAGERSFRESLRSIAEQQQLCGIVFQHPGHYAEEATIRKRDICLRYPIDEARPLSRFLYVAPLGRQQLVVQPEATYQVNLLFEITKLSGAPNLALQFVLTHGSVGPWPPSTYLYWATSVSIEHD